MSTIAVGGAEEGVVEALSCDRTVGVMLKLLIAATVIGSIPNVLCLMGESFTWVGHYHKVVNSILVVLAVYFLVRKRGLQTDLFLLVGIGMVLFGMIVGIIRGGELRYYISHVYLGLFPLLLYAVGYNAKLCADDLVKWVSQYSKYAIISYSIAIVFYVMLMVSGNIRFVGMSPNELLLPFAYYLVVRKRWYVLVILVITVLSGKRGVLLALIAEYVVCAIPMRSLTWKLVLSAALTLLVFLGLFYLLTQVAIDDDAAGIQQVIGKWSLLNPLNEDFDLARGSSTRSSEITQSMASFDSSFWSWITGLGYGWTYFNTEVIRGVETYNYFRHYLHFSPLNYLYLYGLPFALLVLGMMWFKLSKAHCWSLVRFGKSSIQYVLVVYFFGALVVGLTAYSYSTDPVMWLAFGCISSLYADRDE